jgi:hypothetical protein
MGAGPQLGRHLPTVAIDRDLGSCSRYLGGEMPTHTTGQGSRPNTCDRSTEQRAAMARVSRCQPSDTGDSRDEAGWPMRAETSRMIALEMCQARNGRDRAPEPDSTQADGIDDVPRSGLADQTGSTSMDRGHTHARSWSRSPTRCPSGAPRPRAGGGVSAQAHIPLGWSVDGSGQR